MTSEPKAPAAPATYLYRQVDRDDNGPDETHYVRIKILTEEGRKFGDVEIPYDQSALNRVCFPTIRGTDHDSWARPPAARPRDREIREMFSTAVARE